MERPTPTLVNPISVQGCTARIGEQVFPLLDISFVRAVTATKLEEPITAEGIFEVEFQLGGLRIKAMASIEGKGEGWTRLGFEKLVPSSVASLRSFLSPRKVGESIADDPRMEGYRHFHGLNECDLWFNNEGSVLFSYLDALDFSCQFVVRLIDARSPLQVGRLPRNNYINLQGGQEELQLLPLNDRESYSRISECRDVVTNFRPVGNNEYQLKQRLLKVLSDALYSSRGAGYRSERELRA